MPIYEYECTKCGSEIEVYQKFSDSPLRTCKHCSGRLHKLVSQSTFHLKGTGWYVTDYANKSASSSSSAEGKGKKTSEKKGEKTNTKSDSATPSKSSAS